MSFRITGLGVLLCFSAAAAPDNDNFANRAPITNWTTTVTPTNPVIQVTLTGTNLTATQEIGEPAIPGFPIRRGSSIWWSWVAPASGLARLTVEGLVLQPAAGVFTGPTVTNLSAVATPLYAGPTNVVIPFFVTNGVAYHFLVDSTGQEGAFLLRFDEIQAALNDDFTNAFILAGSNTNVTGTLAYATSESGEPIPPGYTATVPSPSVWWLWTAPSSGPVSVRVDRYPKFGNPMSGFYYPGIAAYEGSSLVSLTAVATNQVGFESSSVSFNAEAGATYHISVNWGTPAARLSDSFLLAVNHAPFFSLASEKTAHDQLVLSLNGDRSRAYSVDASTNLVNWLPIGMLTQTNGFQLVDSTTNWPRRFYRARAEP